MESFAKAVKLDLSAHILGKVGTFDSALLFESFWKGSRYFYFDLDMTFTLMCDLDLINDM